MLENSLRCWYVSFPQYGHFISSSSQEVITIRTPLNIPYGPDVPIKFRQTGLEPQAPQLDALVHSCGKHKELVITYGY